VATPRPITFLSDYGYEDEFAGVCRAVISQIAPGAPLIDLTHGVARQDVRQGAVALANASASTRTASSSPRSSNNAKFHGSLIPAPLSLRCTNSRD